jgi:zinc transport system substrate-binding protein
MIVMSVRGLISVPLALLVGLSALTGCAPARGSGKPQVVASFYPLQFVAQEIAGNHADVTNLTKPGVEPHDLDLPPRQAANIAAADVVLHEEGLQPAVDEAVRNDGPKRVVDAARVVRLRAADDGPGEDPHFWLDPTLLAKVAQSFTEAISAADPKHATQYRASNDQLQSRLRALDAAYRTGLANCRSRTLVVSHDAFNYLGSRYHLTVHSIAGLSPDAEPSPRHLQELADLIRTDKITTVFSERLASPKLADSLASDLGITTAVLDPIEGLTSSDPSDNYLSLMRKNLAAIQKAGGCT